jgi:hypothetical protein
LDPPERISFVPLLNERIFPFDTWTSLFFLRFIGSERLKGSALFLLNIMLGNVLLHTPYVQSSNLGLNIVSISAHLAETWCIHALPLLSLLDSVLAVIVGFNLRNQEVLMRL